MRTIAEWEALTGDEALAPAEVALIAAVRAGVPCILNDRKRPTAPSPATKVRAKLLRLLITGATPDCGTQDYGIWLEGGWITGTLDLEFAWARGRTVLNNSHFEALPLLTQANLNELSMGGSYLPGLFAQGLRVGGNLFLSRVEAKGTVDVSGAEVGGQVSCTGAELEGAGDKALSAQGVQTGQSFFLRGVKARGTVDVNAAKVGGQLACTGADFDGVGGKALNAQGVETGLSFFVDGLKAKGTVDIAGARVGGQLDCQNAELDGVGSLALNAQRIHVSKGFVWRDVSVKAGRIDLTAGYVSDLSDEIASWPRGLEQLGLDGFTYDRINGVTRAVDRRSWLRSGSWLRGDFLPQPYTQLARVLRAMGHDREARVVLLEREKILARQDRREIRVSHNGRLLLPLENPLRDLLYLAAFLWDWLSRLIVGYGHAPHRAIWAALALILPTALLYAHAYSEGAIVPNSDVILTSPGWWWSMWQGPDEPAIIWAALPTATHYETFYPLAYAFDVFVPLVDIGQDRAWSATTVTWLGWAVRVWTMVLEVLGWIVTALGAAAITGIMQRDRE